MNGYKEDLDLDQKMTLDQVRENLSDVLAKEHDDRFLIRFLKARLFHEGETEKMVRNHLRWRKHFSVEYLLKEYKPPKNCTNLLNLAVLGFTNEGDIIRILRLGKSDIKGVLLGNTSQEIDAFVSYIITTDQSLIEANSIKTGGSGGKAMYIGDFENINVYDLPWKFALSTLIRLVKLFEAHFPEHLRAVYVINCQSVMYWVLKFLKPFMSEVTASKIHIFGTEDYKEVFQKYVEPTILPDFLGGVRCDTADDKLCTYLKTKMEELPESSYCSHARRLSATDPGVTEVKVEKRSSLYINIEVHDSDYAIVWVVDVQDYDLGIGLFYRENPDSEKFIQCIRPVRRCKAHNSPHTGMHICVQPGTCALMLDNTYSYFTEKTALYKIQVNSTWTEKASI